MEIGARLREERKRLGLTQPALARLTGTTKPTVISWEQGKTAPNGFHIAQLVAADIDVLYLFTGQRNAAVLNADEKEVITRFRSVSPVVKATIIGALRGAEKASKTSNIVPIKSSKHNKNRPENESLSE